MVKNIVKLCVQDIAISKGKKRAAKTARVLFDLGSQATLVRDKCAEQAGWSSTKANYTLAGIGASATPIQGRLWNVSLIDKNGRTQVVKGYGVPEIVQEDWYFPAIKHLASSFPSSMQKNPASDSTMFAMNTNNNEGVKEVNMKFMQQLRGNQSNK